MKNGSIVIKLNVNIGGARLALQRYIGDLANVGNIQISMPYGHGWRDNLVELLDLLKAFRNDLIPA